MHKIIKKIKSLGLPVQEWGEHTYYQRDCTERFCSYVMCGSGNVRVGECMDCWPSMKDEMDIQFTFIDILSIKPHDMPYWLCAVCLHTSDHGDWIRFTVGVCTACRIEAHLLRHLFLIKLPVVRELVATHLNSDVGAMIIGLLMHFFRVEN
jgi:hypothetical protein